MKSAQRIIAVANQKGGVGKTTTAVNLATAMSAVGRKVLLIDCDPQGNASTGLGVAYGERSPGIYEVLVDGASFKDAVHETEIPGLHIATSTVDLSAAEIELTHVKDKEYVLKRALEKVASDYDSVIIDCPPSLGLLTVNALSAADSVMVPMQCEFYALEGLSHLLQTIELVQAHLNPELKLGGVLLTMVDRRNRLTNDVESDVRDYLKDVVFDTVIPRNVRLSEAPSHGKPAIVYDHRCTGSHAYLKLAREFLDREHLMPPAAQIAQMGQAAS